MHCLFVTRRSGTRILSVCVVKFFSVSVIWGLRSDSVILRLSLWFWMSFLMSCYHFILSLPSKHIIFSILILISASYTHYTVIFISPSWKHIMSSSHPPTHLWCPIFLVFLSTIMFVILFWFFSHHYAMSGVWRVLLCTCITSLSYLFAVFFFCVFDAFFWCLFHHVTSLDESCCKHICCMHTAFCCINMISCCIRIMFCACHNVSVMSLLLYVAGRPDRS